MNSTTNFYLFWSRMNLQKLDLTDSYLENKKKVKALELYKLKITKRNYYSSPVGIAGIFMAINITAFTRDGIIMLCLILIIMAASIFINLKYILPAGYKRLNAEIEQLNRLEKEE